MDQLGSAGCFSALIGVCHLRLHLPLEAPLIENIQESPFTCMRVSAGISWELECKIVQSASRSVMSNPAIP